MQPIFLVPLELHNLDFFDRLGSVLGDIFETEVHTRPGREMPAHAYHRRREQYNSPAVLEALNPVLENGTGGAGSVKDIDLSSAGGKAFSLLITAEDLYTEGLNFVFGQAIPGRGVGIISLARLEQEPGKDLPLVKGGMGGGGAGVSVLFFERTVKESVHEIGHLKGLSHCPDAGCVMHFSNSLRDTDRKSRYFCTICRNGLGDRGKF